MTCARARESAGERTRERAPALVQRECAGERARARDGAAHHGDRACRAVGVTLSAVFLAWRAFHVTGDQHSCLVLGRSWRGCSVDDGAGPRRTSQTPNERPSLCEFVRAVHDCVHAPTAAADAAAAAALGGGADDVPNAAEVVERVTRSVRVPSLTTTSNGQKKRCGAELLFDMSK